MHASNKDAWLINKVEVKVAGGKFQRVYPAGRKSAVWLSIPGRHRHYYGLPHARTMAFSTKVRKTHKKHKTYKSSRFALKYRTKWPHCTNIKCMHGNVSIFKTACAKDKRCNGFSFTAHKSTGGGCLKQKCTREGIKGWGHRSHGYYVKQIVHHRIIPKKKKTNKHVENAIKKKIAANARKKRAAHKRKHAASGPTVYQHCNYRGYAKRLSKNIPWVHHAGIKNDDLSSIKVPKGWCATLYQHRNYRGKSWRICGNRNISCFTKHRMSGRTTWNDHVSSIKISRHTVRRHTGPHTMIIKARHGKCLDASQRNKTGGKVHMWNCNRNNKNQHWVYDARTGQIKAKHGKCLDASQRNRTGGKVHMWNCNTRNKNQMWHYDHRTGRIKAKHGKCLD